MGSRLSTINRCAEAEPSRTGLNNLGFLGYYSSPLLQTSGEYGRFYPTFSSATGQAGRRVGGQSEGPCHRDEGPTP